MDRLRLPLPTVIAILALAAGAAGCGEDSDAGGPPTKEAPPPTIGEFREAANAYCAEAGERLTARTGFGGLAATEHFARVAGRITARLRTEVALLEVPDRFREQRARYTTNLDVAVRELGAVESAAAARDRGAVADALEELSEKPGEVARSIGLRDCAAFANAVARTP